MKAYKIRSFLFFCCFVAAATFYYNLEQEENLQEQMAPAEMVDLKTSDSNNADEKDKLLEDN